MTSYNPLNGYWTASNYDLVTTILRGQWCYTGIVMSDWWAEGNDRDGAGSTKHVAAMVRAQNDVFMVVTDPEHNSGSDDLAVALTEGRLIRGELQRSAANICRFCCKHLRSAAVLAAPRRWMLSWKRWPSRICSRRRRTANP